MTDLTNMPIFAESTFLLLSVLLVKSLLINLAPHDPLRFFRFYCLRLADKVNNASNSQQQQKIAGLIAAVITLVPIVLILSLFETLVEIPQLWHALLLYLALGAFGLTKLAVNIAQASAKNDKYLAKQLLSTQVLRDTEQLSLIGVNKACIEMVLLRSIQQQFVVCSVFLAVGPLAALIYRLLLEMHYSWNSKQQAFIYFGQWLTATVNLIQWLPVRIFFLFQLIMTVNQSTILYWRLVKRHFFKNNNNIVVSYLAYTLTIKLGGVAMYNLIKLRRSNFNEQGQQPQAKDIVLATKSIVKVQILALSLLVVVLLMLLSSN